MTDAPTPLQGVLFIGDPHLASRTPGFRVDDYPRVSLEKLRWCLDHAARERLLPVLLGDLFHWPRDNANWLLAELMPVLAQGVLAVMGNHDCRENGLREDDSLTILTRAGRVRLLEESGPWIGDIGGCTVAIGGTAWGTPLPEAVDLPQSPRWTFWVTHHDIGFPGYVAAAPDLKPRPIPGVDVVVNGHIHEPLPDVVQGQTTWLNPGNITRLARDKVDLARKPAALTVLITPDGWRALHTPVPHQRQVFAPVEEDPRAGTWADSSQFIQGLGALLARRTDSGAGLMDFLDKNLSEFDPRVAHELRDLAKEVLPDDTVRPPDPAPGDGNPPSALRGPQPQEDPR